MILIADSGSTKTSWVLTDGSRVIQKITTSGFNPYYYNNSSLLDAIKQELIPKLNTNEVEKIYFYGSGCSCDINCTMVKSSLWQLFPNSLVEVNHDLYGAAIALLNNNEGIACILGTGSNSCLWDGNTIVQNVPSVGYLLGDEGSGTYIGMKILKGILENKAPKEIIDKFYDYYNTDFEGVLDTVYNKPEPNRFISGITKFIGENISKNWVNSTIKQCFIDFIENQVEHYSNYKNIPVSFTGSISFHFKEILLEACSEKGIKSGIILKDPIEGLIDYHKINS